MILICCRESPKAAFTRQRLLAKPISAVSIRNKIFAFTQIVYHVQNHIWILSQKYKMADDEGLVSAVICYDLNI